MTSKRPNAAKIGTIGTRGPPSSGVPLDSHGRGELRGANCDGRKRTGGDSAPTKIFMARGWSALQPTRAWPRLRSHFSNLARFVKTSFPQTSAPGSDRVELGEAPTLPAAAGTTPASVAASPSRTRAHLTLESSAARARAQLDQPLGATQLRSGSSIARPSQILAHGASPSSLTPALGSPLGVPSMPRRRSVFSSHSQSLYRAYVCSSEASGVPLARTALRASASTERRWVGRGRLSAVRTGALDLPAGAQVRPGTLAQRSADSSGQALDAPSADCSHDRANATKDRV